MAFVKGTPKPKGSGMQTGQKTKKTIARENAQAEAMKELSAMCKQHAGKDAKQIMEDMGYNPVVHAILLATKIDNPSIQQKLVEGLMKKHSPDLKSIEVQGQETHTIKIVLDDGTAPSMFNYFNNDPSQALEQPSPPLSLPSSNTVADEVIRDDDEED